MKRKIIDHSNGRVYSSLTEAAMFLGIKYGTLAPKLSGHRNNDTSLRYLNDKLDYNEGLTLADVERGFIIDTYRFYGKNNTKIANKLGISRGTLIRKIKQYKDEGYIL